MADCEYDNDEADRERASAEQYQRPSRLEDVAPVEEQIRVKIGHRDGRVWIRFSQKVDIIGLTPLEVASFVQNIVASLKACQVVEEPKIVRPNGQIPIAKGKRKRRRR